MYCDFYQLTERPFNVTPDPKFLYLNARYREAIASLNYGITQRKGFITLIGEAGTGKTTLLKKLLEDLDSKTRTVFIFNTNVTFEEILEYIFGEFDLPVHNGKKLYMLQRLNAFLLEELRGGGNVALLIDEAQDLEFSVLEDLRLLSNLETAKEKILQIVLSGQPELGQKLSNPVLRQLRQRIGINCRLLPLSRDEVTEYIRCRLEAAQCPDLKLFSREAEDQIYHFSRGIPRLVNVVSDNALVIGYALGKRRIGADIIAEAAADLMSLEPQLGEVREQPVVVAAPQAPERPRNQWRARFGVSSVVLVVALAGLLSIGRTALHKPTDEPAAETPPPARLEVIRPGSEPRGSGVGYSSEPTSGGVEQAGVLAAPADGAAMAAGLRLSEKELAATDTAARPAERPKTDVVIAKQPETDAAAPAVAQPTAAPERPEEAKGKTPVLPERDMDAGSSGFVLAGNALRLDGVQFAPVVAHAGDSISGIARRQYGQASYTILDLLKLANPELRDVDVIAAGQTIRLPELGDGFPILNDGSGHYALLVLSTPQQRRATALQHALRSHGFAAAVTTGNVGARKPLYRVVLSGFAGRDEGIGVGRQVQQVFREDARLAQLGE